MTKRGARLVAWSLLGLSAALLLAGVVLAIVDPHSGGPANPSSAGPTLDDAVAGETVPFAVFQAVIFSLLAGTGAIVAARRPRNPMGWLFGVAALFLAVLMLSDTLYWHAAFGDPGAHDAAEVALWVENWAWIPALVALFSLVPLLFPTGAPPSPRWRFVGWVAVTTGIVTLLATAFSPGPLQNTEWVTNPLGLGGLGLRTVAEASFIIWLASALAAVVSLVVRFRRSRGIERQQLKWVTAAGCLLVVSFPVSGLLTDGVSEAAGWACLLFALLGLAVALSVALLRFRLYDIDVVINRTLVYGALTATLAAAYLGCVLLLQLLLGGLTGDSSLAVAGSTLAVAALFRPARGRIQDVVDRRFYRRKYDAAQTLERFGEQLRDEVDLGALTAELRSVVTETMQPAHVSVWLRSRRWAMSPRVEPEWAMVTVLVVDIRGFTTLADRTTAREAVDYLNEFFELVVPILTGHGGHANKLLGDGVLGIFGAPERLPDHADRALAAAADMLAAVESQFGERCRIGIGINSGLVLVGTHRWRRPLRVRRDRGPRERRGAHPGRHPRAGRAAAPDGGDALPARAARTPACDAHGALRLKGKAEPVTIYGLPSRNASWTPLA